MSGLFIIKSQSATSAVTVVAASPSQALSTYDDMASFGRRHVVTYDEAGAELSRERLLELIANPQDKRDSEADA